VLERRQVHFDEYRWIISRCSGSWMGSWCIVVVSGLLVLWGILPINFPGPGLVTFLLTIMVFRAPNSISPGAAPI